MNTKRPESYSTLPYAMRMQVMQQRAQAFMVKPEFWFAKLELLA